jgi:hypothetical protein
MARKKSPQPARCPCCNQEVSFGLVIAKLRTFHFLQRRSHDWKLDVIDPPEFVVQTPLLMICASCSTPTLAPASLVQAYNRKAGVG